MIILIIVITIDKNDQMQSEYGLNTIDIILIIY